jgi:antitoxin component YwqK of YwqJK toxin-antitoxin module
MDTKQFGPNYQTVKSMDFIDVGTQTVNYRMNIITNKDNFTDFGDVGSWSGQSSKARGQLEYEYNYQQGQKHGLCRGWYEVSGQSSEAHGQLWYESNYHQGQSHGLSRRWNSNGQLSTNVITNTVN